MSMVTLFAVGNYNFSNSIVNGTYEINTYEINDTYKDCNEVTHYIHLRDQIKGKFDIAFRNYNEYMTFVGVLAGYKNQTTNSWSVYVSPNNSTRSGVLINARVTYAPKRELAASGLDVIRQVTVTVEEL